MENKKLIKLDIGCGKHKRERNDKKIYSKKRREQNISVWLVYKEQNIRRI